MSVLWHAGGARPGAPEEALLFGYLPDAGVSCPTHHVLPEPATTSAAQARSAPHAATRANHAPLFPSSSLSAIGEDVCRSVSLRHFGSGGIGSWTSA